MAVETAELASAEAIVGGFSMSVVCDHAVVASLSGSAGGSSDINPASNSFMMTSSTAHIVTESESDADDESDQSCDKREGQGWQGKEDIRQGRRPGHQNH